MKKLFTLFLVLSLTCFLSASAEAAYTTTLEIFGGIMADGEIGVAFPEDSTPSIATQDFSTTDPALLSQLNTYSPYLAIAALEYDVDYNLPDWTQEYMWTLDVDVWAQGSTYVYVEGYPEGPVTDLDDIAAWTAETDFDVSFQDSIPLGTFSLENALGGHSQAEVFGFLDGLPADYYEPGVGGYINTGGLDGGTIYAAADWYVLTGLPNDDTLLAKSSISLDNMPYGIDPELFDPDFDGMSAVYGGTIALTATPLNEQVVPEPGTLALLGSGLVGLFGLRKKRS